MPLPDTINQSYAPGTPWTSQDMNDLQKWTAEQWSIIRHAGYSFREDFDGTDLGALAGAASFNSTNFASGGTAANNFALVDDTANNSSGAVQFNHVAPNVNSLTSNASLLAFGQSDLYMTARLRVPSLGGANSTVRVGLLDFAGTNNSLQMVYNPTVNGNANWWLHYGVTAALTKVDTGVAPATSVQQIIDVVRTAGVITVAFNNAAPAVTASPSPFNLDKVQHMINCNATTSGTTNCIVDYYKLWSRTPR
jgi:hypothetical protein